MKDDCHMSEGSSKSGVKYTNLSFIRFSNYSPKKETFAKYLKGFTRNDHIIKSRKFGV